ncbi:CHAP domain-containing protein [Streptococcus cameli]
MFLSVKKKYLAAISVAFISVIVVMWTPSVSADSKTSSLGLGKGISKIVSEASLHQKDIQVIVYTPNTYPIGQCTWGAKELAPWIGNNWGNAGEWASVAASEGYTVSTVPKVGAVMVWTDGGYGHVAVVTEVRNDGLIQVEESNYAGNMTIGNYRGVFDPVMETAYAQVSFIYPK